MKNLARQAALASMAVLSIAANPAHAETAKQFQPPEVDTPAHRLEVLQEFMETTNACMMPLKEAAKELAAQFTVPTLNEPQFEANKDLLENVMDIRFDDTMSGIDQNTVIEELKQAGILAQNVTATYSQEAIEQRVDDFAEGQPLELQPAAKNMKEKYETLMGDFLQGKTTVTQTVETQAAMAHYFEAMMKAGCNR